MEAGFMYEPLRRVIPGDEPPPAVVALAEVPLVGVPAVVVPLVEVPLVTAACGDPVAAWV
jgi:hypothetical protein